MGPRNGFVNFAFISLGRRPWLSSASQKGLRLPQGSRTIDTKVVVAEKIWKHTSPVKFRIN